MLDQCVDDVETSQSIWVANHLIGFYIIIALGLISRCKYKVG